MLCRFCGTYSGEDEIVCPNCGRVLPRGENRNDGVMAIRQGRRARAAAASGQPPMETGRQGTDRVYVDPLQRPENAGQIPVYADSEVYSSDGRPLSERENGLERHTRTSYGDTTMREPVPVMTARSRKKSMHVARREINWMHVGILILIFMLLAALGVYIYLDRTDNGQRILARMGRDATSQAYWEVGEERMDTGDIDGAIADFEHAVELDGEENLSVTGLLMLASCYEAAGRTADAETIYIRLYTDVVPSAPDAYTNEIRILQATGRPAQAAELMALAYEKTGNIAFQRQRTDLLPTPPSTSLGAGLYEIRKYVSLSSPQGFDVYYTFSSEAKLPEEGELFTEDIYLDEGIWNLRAVSVNGELVSDELKAVYRIIMPSPQQPAANLAPNTYKTRQRVRLRPGEENKDDKDITIYYTIDGSIPDGDSPVYTGEPIVLPGWYVDLHAVAVNGYGKASNMLEIRYKILAKPYPLKSYTTEDTASGIRLAYTTWDSFRNTWGNSERMEEVQISGIDSICQKQIYPWGYAVFYRTSGNYLLQELYFTTDLFSGPRQTGIGNTENDVVSKFRDMGQVTSPSGNRGLYENSEGKGQILVQEDGGKIIRYTASTADSHKWQLTYTLNSRGVVVAIDQMYIP